MSLGYPIVGPYGSQVINGILAHVSLTVGPWVIKPICGYFPRLRMSDLNSYTQQLPESTH